MPHGRGMKEKSRRFRLAQDRLRRSGDPAGGTVRELQELTGMDVADIRLALCADRARQSRSIDQGLGLRTRCRWRKHWVRTTRLSNRSPTSWPSVHQVSGAPGSS